MPEIPPWIKAADPATAFAHGAQIGVSIGAQRNEQLRAQQQMAERAQEFQQEMSAQEAAQRFKEMQAQRSAQLDAQHQALLENEFGLRAQEAARKAEAVQKYQSAVAGGMDPNEAMLQFGPAMAANTGTAAAIRAQQRMAKAPVTWKEVDLPGGIKTVQSSTGQLRFAPTVHPGAVPHLPEGSVYVPATENTPAHWTTPKTAHGGMTDYQIANLQRGLEKDFEKILENNPQFAQQLATGGDADPKWSDRTKAQWKLVKQQADAIRSKMDQLQNGQVVPAGAAPPGAGGGGGVINVVRNANGELVIAGQQQAAARRAPLMAPPEGVTTIDPSGAVVPPGGGQGQYNVISPEGLVTRAATLPPMGTPVDQPVEDTTQFPAPVY